MAHTSVPHQHKWQKTYYYLPEILIMQKTNNTKLNWNFCMNRDLNAYEHWAFIDSFEMTNGPLKIVWFISSVQRLLYLGWILTAET